MRKEGAWKDARVAAEYDRRRFAGPLQRRKHRRDVALVLRLLARAGATGPVLDLPTGTGRLLPELGAAGFAVVGADVSRAMLSHRPAGTGPVVQASAAALPFRDASFAAVVSLRFLFHVEAGAEREAMLREMGRVGTFVLGQVRYRWNLKHGFRFLRSLVGLSPSYKPSSGRAAIARELAGGGLELVELVAVSRVFSDKAFFLGTVPQQSVTTSRRRGAKW